MGVEPELDLLCLGGSSVDLLLRLEHPPEADEKMLAEFAGRLPGGLVANTACAAARLGLRTAWAGQLGDDEGASLLLADFDRYGVNTTRAVQRVGMASDFCVILLQPGGERSILVVNTLPDLPALDGLASSRVVYTLPYQLDWLTRLARQVHGGGGLLAVDVEAATPLQGEDLTAALRQCDLVFCSTGGLRLVAKSEDIAEGLSRILALGPRLVVCTLGSRGAWAATTGERVCVPALPVRAVDTTGAGDCFHAAFLGQYLSGQPLERCLRFAHAAAALSVQQMGARGGLPTTGEVQEFLARVGEG